jgi:hypothetical protein
MRAAVILKYKTIISSAILILLFLCLSPAFARPVSSSGLDDAVSGLNRTAGQAYEGAPSTGGLKSGITDIPTAIGTIVGAILAFVGVIFFVLMIYGGFLWMMARGNEQEAAKAKDLIVAAVIGLIIVLAAYAITAYIGGALTS